MEGAEWSNFNATVCVNEEADFMAQLFPNPNDVNLNYTHNYQIMANNKDINEDGSSYFSCDSISNTQNLYPFSHDSCYDHRRNDHHDHDHHDHDDVHHYHNDCFNDDDNHHHHHLASASLPIEFLQCHMEGHENNDNEDQSEMDNNTVAEDNKISSSSSCKIAKKRPRALEVQRGKKNMKVKRSRSNLSLGGGDNEEEEEKDGNKSCSSGSLEDDCSSKGGTTTTSTTNTTTNTNTKAVNSNGKTRASRGSATDPQSLYARKRRERINERLKILQSLVPNGTKVDISTMLEEAVQYVKFLQLQIKLLSSDEHWMYAPIAYNGMNIGLDFKINLPR